MTDCRARCLQREPRPQRMLRQRLKLMLRKTSPEHPPSCGGLCVPPVPSGQVPAFIAGEINPNPAKAFSMSLL